MRIGTGSSPEVGNGFTGLPGDAVQHLSALGSLALPIQVVGVLEGEGLGIGQGTRQLFV